MPTNGLNEAPEILLRKAHNRVDEPGALLEIGLRLLTARHSPEAREVFEIGRRVAAEQPEFDLGVGACLMQESEYELARQHLVSHLQRFPNSAVGYFQLACSLCELDREEEMIDNLLKSITIAPSNQQALTLLHNQLLRRGDRDQARSALERFGNDLRAAGPRLFLAGHELEQGNEPGAGGYLDQALADLQVEDGEALILAADLLVKLGRSEECVELLEDLTDGLPSEALGLLAQAYRGAGEPGRAAVLEAKGGTPQWRRLM